MSCSGDRHHFTPGSSRCDCGKASSALATSGLPYSTWLLDEATRRGTPHSQYANATDPRTGHTYVVREYLPDAASASLAQRRRFVTVAKALRNSRVEAQRLLYPYTRNGRCYTVADTVRGTPLSLLHPPGGTPETACLARLESILAALRELGGHGTVAGPLFHGDLRLENILATSPEPDAPLQLVHSLYLENLLRDQPLPPEHFQQGDLLASAELVLSLAPGPLTPTEKLSRLKRITDPVLGATLEYLFGAQGMRPNGAGAALDYLHLLQRATATHDRTLFEQANAISPSPRLRPFLLPPGPAPQPPRPVAPPPPPRPTAPVGPPPSPAYPPFVPVSQPKAAPNSAPRPKPPTRRRRSGLGCLLPLLILFLLLSWVVTMLTKRPNVPTSLDFSAEPNPAPRRATVQLHWTTSGFDRVELDGRRVGANGSLLVIANTPHHYRLAGIRPDGSRKIRDLEVNILPRHIAKPPPGVPLLPAPDAATPMTHPTDAAGTNPETTSASGIGSSNSRPVYRMNGSLPRPDLNSNGSGAEVSPPPAPIVRRPPSAAGRGEGVP